MTKSEIEVAYRIEVSNADLQYNHALEMAERRRDGRRDALSPKEPAK